MPLELIVSDQTAAGVPERARRLRRVRVAAALRCWINPEWAWLVEAYSLDRLAGIESVVGFSIDPTSWPG